VKELVEGSNKCVSKIIALNGMIALLEVGLEIGHVLNSGIGTSTKFQEDTKWKTGNLSLLCNSYSASSLSC
jgi:hypothetical protein